MADGSKRVNTGRELDTRSSYSDEEIKLGLVAVAVHSGNARKAEKALGGKFAHRTLHRWVKRHPEKYQELRRTVVPEIREKAAEQHQELAEYEAGISRQMAERLEREYEGIPARDLPGAIRNLDTGSAINTDKALVLRGEASVITEHRSLAENIKALEAKGVTFIDDSPKVVEAEVVVEDAPQEELASSNVES